MVNASPRQHDGLYGSSDALPAFGGAEGHVIQFGSCHCGQRLSGQDPSTKALLLPRGRSVKRTCDVLEWVRR